MWNNSQKRASPTSCNTDFASTFANQGSFAGFQLLKQLPSSVLVSSTSTTSANDSTDSQSERENDSSASEATSRRSSTVKSTSHSYGRLPPACPSPRGVCSDKRAEMIAMFTQVMNSFEFSVIHNFIKKFCRPDCTLMDKAKHVILGNAYPPVLTCGLDNVARALTYDNEEYPDMVGLLLNTSLQTYRDGSSKATFFIRLQGTKIAQRASIHAAKPSEFPKLNLLIHGEFDLDYECNVSSIFGMVTPSPTVLSH